MYDFAQKKNMYIIQNLESACILLHVKNACIFLHGHISRIWIEYAASCRTSIDPMLCMGIILLTNKTKFSYV